MLSECWPRSPQGNEGSREVTPRESITAFAAWLAMHPHRSLPEAVATFCDAHGMAPVREGFAETVQGALPYRLRTSAK